MSERGEDKVLASYVLGILSIVFAFFQPVPGIILGIIGFNLSKKEKGDFSKKARKYNKLGIILGVIILIATIIFTVYAISSGLSGLSVPAN